MGDSHMGLQARLMSQALRKLTANIKRSNTLVIFINQIRMKIGVMFGCFHYDTLVNFTNGKSIPIGKVVDEKIKGDIFCLNEKTNEIEVKPIIDFHDNGNVKTNDDFIHIQTQSINGGGRFGLTCTPNHKILTENGWLEAQNLSFNDKLISKYEQTINGTYGEFLTGMLIGDSGIYIRDKNTAKLKLQDNENIEYLNWKLDKLKPFLNFNELEINRGYRYDSEFTYEFAKIKRELGERNPLYMLENNYSDLALAIWFMDDGNYDSSYGHNRYTISIKRFKNQENILNKIKDVLSLKTGIAEIKVNPKNGTLNFTTQATQDFAKLICKYIPKAMQYKLPDEFKDKYEEFTLENKAKFITDSVEIKEIRLASNRQMRSKRKFDISIADNSNYMVGGYKNGIIVHNSPEVTSGGNALKFYASVRMDIRRIGAIKRGDEIVGNETRVKILKNKIAPPFKEVKFDIIYGEGISRESEVIDIGVAQGIINKAGAWYSYKGDKIGQGKEKVRAFLKEYPDIAAEVEEQIRAKLLPKKDDNINENKPKNKDKK
jgi:recombination protein RecA